MAAIPYKGGGWYGILDGTSTPKQEFAAMIPKIKLK